MNLSEPATIEVSQQTMPAWTYSEIGASAANGTIVNDLLTTTAQAPDRMATIYTSGQNASGILAQWAVPAGKDGHFVVFDLWAARHDWTRFLASHALTGQAVLY